MRKIQEFIAWALSHADPSNIPVGSKLCVPIERVGVDGVWQYLYGTTGRRCTESLLRSRFAKYYKGWGWKEYEFKRITADWPLKGVTVCDCQGLEDYFSGADTNAKGNYARYCTDKGKRTDIPRKYVVGEAVFCGKSPASINHVGWVCGFAPNGEPLIVHERGLAYGCRVDPMSASGKTWTYRGLMTKRYEYPAYIIPPHTVTDEPRRLVLGLEEPKMRGEAVALLQNALNRLGYPCGQPDGIVGVKTMKGVREFVLAHKDE